MFRKALVLTSLILVISVSQAKATVYSNWDGGGDDNSWSDADNWDPNIVPHGDFEVYIKDAEVEIKQDRIINSLHTSGEVSFGCWNSFYDPTLTFTNPLGLTNEGVLRLENIEFSGSFTNEDNAFLVMDEVTGDISIEGNFINNGSVFVSSPCPVLSTEGVEGSFINNGKMHLQNALVTSGETDANMVNAEGAVIWGSGTVFTENALVNSGRIISSSGALQIHVHEIVINNVKGILETMSGSSLCISSAFFANISKQMTNNGTIMIAPDSAVTFVEDRLWDPGLLSDCTLVNDANGNIQLQGGTLAAATIVQVADANFVGFGKIHGDVYIEPNGLIKLTGPTNVVGDVEIGTAATLEVSDGLTLITGQTTCNGTIHMKGGYIIPQGGLSGACNIIWEPGIYTNVADFNLDGRVNFKDFAYFANTWLWESGWL